MDDEPMWAADRVVAPTLGFAVTIPEPKMNLQLKEMLRNYHGHNLSKGNIIKIFNHGLNEITQVLNAAAGGIFLYKTPNQAYQLLKDKVLLNLDWAKNKKPNHLLRKPLLSSLKKTVKFPLSWEDLFLYTADAVIRVKQKQLNLGVGTERMIFNIDFAIKHTYSNDDTCFSIDVIDEILEEDFDALLDEGSEILHSIEGTILEEKLFAKFDEFMTITVDENSKSESNTEEPTFKKITFNTDYKIKTSLEEPSMDLKLKPLPDNLEYVFLEEPSFVPVIISSQLSKENKNKLVSILKKHKKAFAWKTIDILGICPSFSTFRRCMLAIFHDMIEESVEVFMDDFSIFGSSFDHCVNNLDKMLHRYEYAHLVLNWEKCHFMVKKGIMLRHKVSKAGLEVNKVKINVISKLPPPTNIKGIRSFLGHADFYRRFIKDFSKIARPLTKLLEKDTQFEFNEECHNAFDLLKEKLTFALVIVSPNWSLLYELMCDASNFAVGAILGQKKEEIFTGYTLQEKLSMQLSRIIQLLKKNLWL
nr:reverse transcriptase domain-containing protein [Tanacetum cinerariifolium]